MDYQTQVMLAMFAPIGLMVAIVTPAYLFIWTVEFYDWLVDIQS